MARSLRGLTLEELDMDVFLNMVDFLGQDRKSLFEFSLTSKWVRHMCLPILFQSCRVSTTQIYEDLLPLVILCYSKCLRITGVYWADQPINLTPLLKRLPLLHTVVFDEAYGGIPWPYIQSCLRQPSIVALSITANAQWAAMPRWIRDTFPTHRDIQAVPLSQLSYSTSSWRDLLARIDEVELVDDCAVEAMCLRMLVPGMRNTAESLHLPMETAPLAQMAHGVWPRLTTLSLEGFYPHPVVSTLSSLLAQMPKLRTFSVQAAQSPESSRAPILGKDRWPQVVPVLRSLTVAYPDPQDAIFSLPSTNLTRLSLRDWPRYYISRYSRRCQLLPNSWVAPILTATECLHILERMDLPRLQSLEVVYEVDDEDERLLHRISTCYPCLSDLEIHRYRKNDHKEVVPHQHIAHTLGSIPHLRRLRLNLRFPNEPIPFEGVDLQRGIEKRRVLDWDNYLCGIAWEIFDAVGANTRPDFEHLALLYHDSWQNLWVYFSIEPDEDGPCQHVDWGFPLRPGQLDWEIPPGPWPEYAGYSY